MSEASLVGLVSGDLLGIDIVVTIAIIVFALLVSTFTLTMGLSVVGHRRDTEQAAVVAEVRDGLLERLSRDRPGWEEWVDTLDEPREEVLLDHLETYLDMLVGRDHERLLELAETLNLYERARLSIETGDTFDRCRALRWLDIMDMSIDPGWLLPRISTARIEREAAAPVLRRHPDGHQLALSLLLEGEYLTGHGMETLYQLIADDPTPTVEHLHEIESTELLSQVLLVLAARPSSDEEPPIEPLTELFEHADERIRARTCLVLGTFAWHEDLKESIDIDTLLGDSPEVRIATYRMLARWRDETARHHLRTALDEETDRRAKIVLVRSLLQHGRRGDRFALAGLVDENLLTWARLEGVASERRDPLL